MRYPTAQSVLVAAIVTFVTGCAGQNGEAPTHSNSSEVATNGQGTSSNVAADGDEKTEESSETLQVDELQWTSTISDDQALNCAEIAAAAPASGLDALVLDSTRVATLRVRVKEGPTTAVPIWAWQVQHAELTDVTAEVVALEDDASSVSVAFEMTGPHTITVHTHYPQTETCGVRVGAEVRFGE